MSWHVIRVVRDKVITGHSSLPAPFTNEVEISLIKEETKHYSFEASDFFSEKYLWHFIAFLLHYGTPVSRTRTGAYCNQGKRFRSLKVICSYEVVVYNDILSVRSDEPVLIFVPQSFSW